MRSSVLFILALTLAACESEPGADVSCDSGIGKSIDPGSHTRLRAPVSVANGLEVIISDVFIPAGVEVPRHYHPGEEFLYVIEGSAMHVEEGKPDRLLTAGDAYVIAPEVIHAPYGGPEGGRAVVFRLHVSGREERYLVPD